VTPIRTPVKRLLRPATTGASATRMWNRIEARTRAAGASRARKRTRARSLGVLAIAAAIAALSAIAALARGWSPSWGGARALPGVYAEGSDRMRGQATPTSAKEPAAQATAPNPPEIERVVPSAEEPAQATAAARATAAVQAPRRGADAASWRGWATRGDPQRAYAELGRDGVARMAASAPVEDLFALADVARLSGHPGEAVAPLERVVRDHPEDPRASLAAYTLGRVRLRSLGTPAAAAAAFEQALALKIPAGLEEETYALWIESLATAGDRPGAARAYERYVSRHPDRARDDELEKWLRAP
jgi:hypothetical protein